jgi:two-component system OmpR family response regulator
MTPRLLLVEDDEPLRDGLFATLTMDGYKVLALPDGSDLSKALEQFRPDLVLLDVYLPEGPDGFELAAVVRTVAGLPILFVTAADSMEQRLRGFKEGADDYVVKPFATAELLARIRAVLRRSGRLTSATLEVRDLVVDEDKRTVLRAGQVVELSDSEFDLLRVLARNPGQVYTKAQLLAQVWGLEGYDLNLVEVCMSRLRRKLEAEGPRMIFTQRGRGYVLRR